MRWFENDKAELEEDISELVVTEESWENQIEAAESKLKCDADEGNPVKEILMNFDAWFDYVTDDMASTVEQTDVTGEEAPVEEAPVVETPAEEALVVEAETKAPETMTLDPTSPFRGKMPVEETAAVEEVPSEESPETPAKAESEAMDEEAPAEEARVEETMEDEEDAPLEDWTIKELKEKCKTLGLSDKGKKAQIIERITEARATTVEASPTEEAVTPVEEIVAVEETEAPVEEAPAVEELAEAVAVMKAEEDWSKLCKFIEKWSSQVKKH